MTLNTATSIPQTLLRSAPQAQLIWKKAHESAVKTYGDLSRAHRAAFAALKNEYQKDGDRWVPKNGKKAAPVQSQASAEKVKSTKPARPAKTRAIKPKETRKASAATATTPRRRRRKTVTNNKTAMRKRSAQRSKK
jgi:cation transport regulator ChaB